MKRLRYLMTLGLASTLWRGVAAWNPFSAQEPMSDDGCPCGSVLHKSSSECLPYLWDEMTLVHRLAVPDPKEKSGEGDFTYESTINTTLDVNITSFFSTSTGPGLYGTIHFKLDPEPQVDSPTKINISVRFNDADALKNVTLAILGKSDGSQGLGIWSPGFDEDRTASPDQRALDFNITVTFPVPNEPLQPSEFKIESEMRHFEHVFDNMDKGPYFKNVLVEGWGSVHAESLHSHDIRMESYGGTIKGTYYFKDFMWTRGKGGDVNIQPHTEFIDEDHQPRVEPKVLDFLMETDQGGVEALISTTSEIPDTSEKFTKLISNHVRPFNVTLPTTPADPFITLFATSNWDWIDPNSTANFRPREFTVFQAIKAALSGRYLQAEYEFHEIPVSISVGDEAQPPKDTKAIGKVNVLTGDTIVILQ